MGECEYLERPQVSAQAADEMFTLEDGRLAYPCQITSPLIPYGSVVGNSPNSVWPGG